jgi:hypothetical protein
VSGRGKRAYSGVYIHTECLKGNGCWLVHSHKLYEVRVIDLMFFMSVVLLSVCE